MQAQHAASLELAVGGGQPTFDIRSTRDHFQQRPVDIAEALNCPPLAAMLNPNLALHLATAAMDSRSVRWHLRHQGRASFPAQLALLPSIYLGQSHRRVPCLACHLCVMCACCDKRA